MAETVIHDVELKISEALGKNVKILSTRTLGGGCINHASKIETTAGNWFLKWNTNCPPDMFEREAEGLRELQKATGDDIKIPEVLCYNDGGQNPGFLVVEYLSAGNPGSDDEKLGRGLAKIHQFTNSGFGFYHNNYCGETPQENSWSDNWITFFRENRIEYLLKLIEKGRGLSSSEIKVYHKVLDRLTSLIPGGSVPALIHGDLWSGNYMLTTSGPALIDPAVYYADREMEFAIITMFGGFSSRFYDSYNEVLPLDSGWRGRNKLYQLYHILNHYSLFGGGYGSQALMVAKSYL